jgi:hypothetical protein
MYSSEMVAYLSLSLSLSHSLNDVDARQRRRSGGDKDSAENAGLYAGKSRVAIHSSLSFNLHHGFPLGEHLVSQTSRVR